MVRRSSAAIAFPATPAAARILSNRSSSAFAEAAIKMTATQRPASGEQKKKPVAWAFAGLDQPPDDVIDRRDMIGVDRVSQSQDVGKHCGAEERRRS